MERVTLPWRPILKLPLTSECCSSCCADFLFIWAAVALAEQQLDLAGWPGLSAGEFAIRLAAAFSIPAVSDAMMTTCLSQSDSPGLQGRTSLLRSSCDELSLGAVAKALLSPLAAAVQLSDSLAPSPAGQS